MASSKQIVEAVVKTIRDHIVEVYTSIGLNDVEDDIVVDRQLFDNSASGGGWLDTVNHITLKTCVRDAVCPEIIVIYPNNRYPSVTVAIALKKAYGHNPGDVGLQGEYFGNLEEPNIISRLKTKIKMDIENWAMNAKVQYEPLPKPRGSGTSSSNKASE